MKKIFFCILWIVGAVAFTSAQENETVDTESLQLAPCGHIAVSHWSIGIKGGANYFRMAPPAPESFDKANLMGGALIEYTINPLFGLGVEYDFNDYTRPYIYKQVEGHLRGATHDAMLYGSFNLSNALSPFRSGAWKILNVYTNAGAGIGFYKADLNFDQLSTGNKNTMLANLGINAEFTLSKSLNFGIEGQYRLYNTPKMGVAKSNTNNDAFIATIGLRYKLASSIKKHARNINMCEYSPRPVPVIVKKIIKGDTQETIDRLKALELENATLKQKIQDDAKNAALKQKMMEDAKNTAIQQNLLTQNTKLQQQLQKMEDDLKNLSTNKEGVLNVSFENIEFKSGSTELTPSSTQLLDQICSILTSSTSWSKVKIYGNTDDVGSSALNQKLSETRALSVKKYMSSKGIPSAKIVSIGMGENNPIAPNDTPEGRQKNRRVEFEIAK